MWPATVQYLAQQSADATCTNSLLAAGAHAIALSKHCIWCWTLLWLAPCTHYEICSLLGCLGNAADVNARWQPADAAEVRPEGAIDQHHCAALRPLQCQVRHEAAVHVG